MSRKTLRTTGLLVLLALLGACSNTPPAQLSTTAEPSDEIPEAVAMAESDEADLEEGFTPGLEDVPSTDTSDGTTTADGTLPRTTTEGINLTSDTTEFDFGEGDVPTLELDAKHPGGSTGIYIPLDQLIADDEDLNALRWAGSGGTFIVLMETGPGVATVRMSSTQGGVDQTIPISDLSVLAVRATELTELKVESLDADGNVLAVCTAESLLLTCEPV